MVSVDPVPDPDTGRTKRSPKKEKLKKYHVSRALQRVGGFCWLGLNVLYYGMGSEFFCLFQIFVRKSLVWIQMRIQYRAR
jgi:hypothetical protein